MIIQRKDVIPEFFFQKSPFHDSQKRRGRDYLAFIARIQMAKDQKPGTCVII